MTDDVAQVKVLVKRKVGTEDLPLPRYQSADAAGMDLLAAVEEDVVLARGEVRAVPTGLYVAIPPGYEAQVRPRSGLALKSGITVANTPGTIDADYRGEVGVILTNLKEAPFTVTRGMRIAQMVIAPVVRARLEEVGELPETKRGAGGFGHTGLEHPREKE